MKKLIVIPLVLLAACASQARERRISRSMISPARTRLQLPLRQPRRAGAGTSIAGMAGQHGDRLSPGVCRPAARPSVCQGPLGRAAFAAVAAAAAAVVGDSAGECTCTLRVELDEFSQVFDAAASSRAVLRGEVLLLGRGVSRRRECPCVSSTHQRALMWRAESMPSLLLPTLLLRISLAGCNSRTFPSAVLKLIFRRFLMTQDCLVLRDDRSDGSTLLTLNRPAQFNSLSLALLAELQAALNDIAGAADRRLVIIAGAGKAFCAGHDLMEMRANTDKSFMQKLFKAMAKVCLSLQRMPQPSIARIHGVATAAGCQLVASCDLAVAPMSPAWYLRHQRRALLHLARGRAYHERRPQGGDGDQACRRPDRCPDGAAAGLVNRVVPAENWMTRLPRWQVPSSTSRHWPSRWASGPSTNSSRWGSTRPTSWRRDDGLQHDDS